MKAKHIAKRLPTFFIAILLVHHCAANSSADTANPYFEISRITSTLLSGNHVQFNVSYYFEKLDSTGLERDTLSGVYKVNGKKFYASIGGNTIVQNDLWSLSISVPDSMMILGRPKPLLASLTNSDILNPALQSNYLSKITQSDSSQFRKMVFVLNSFSPYSQYEFCYDTTTYHMSHLKYRLRLYDSHGLSSGYYLQMKVVFTNYQNSAFSDDVFDTSIYLRRNNGIFNGVGAYSNFEIVNQLLNQ